MVEIKCFLFCPEYTFLQEKLVMLLKGQLGIFPGSVRAIVSLTELTEVFSLPQAKCVALIT